MHETIYNRKYDEDDGTLYQKRIRRKKSWCRLRDSFGTWFVHVLFQPCNCES